MTQASSLKHARRRLLDGCASSACCRARAARASRAPAGLTIAVIPKGTSHVVLAEHPRRRGEGGAGAGRRRSSGAGRCARTIARRRCPKSKGFVTPRRVGHRARAARRRRARRRRSPTRCAAKIPVVIIDSGLKGDDYVSFVATDNRQGGRLAGERLAKLLHDRRQGRAAALRRRVTTAPTQREAGFLEAIEAHPGIQVVSANQYGGADVEGAYKKSEALLSSFKTPDGSLDVDGIFTPNESTTLAMLRVLQDNGWAGKVKFVGFDASDTWSRGCATATSTASCCRIR